MGVLLFEADAEGDGGCGGKFTFGPAAGGGGERAGFVDCVGGDGGRVRDGES